MTDGTSKYLDFTQKPDFEQILTNPILDIAARFWDDDRYAAFKVCYRSMRVIDDLVDDRKSAGRRISEAERSQLSRSIETWVTGLNENRPADSFQKQLLDTITDFRIPLWPWQRLARAMLYDLNNDGFATLTAFLRYAEGAAIAPASVFMHLCGVRGDNRKIVAPDFNIRAAARHLALFSYTVHIMRDLQKDQAAGLNYFAADFLKRHGLTERDLRKQAVSGTVSAELRNLIGDYCRIAQYYQSRARRAVDAALTRMEPRYQLSLQIIYNLYSQIFERINPQS
ncbi:MAG: squalene/phytoene synthase family protein, partial [Candidatus Zixiibacteriota bacterium]